MNRIIEFIKRLFKKPTLALNVPQTIENRENPKQPKEEFLKDIKIDTNNIKDNISDLQKKLENGSLSEEKLNKEQIRKIKKVYCNQILDLLYSIKNYKIKVN